MGVAHLSMSPASVYASCGPRLESISRLRRVAASIMTVSSRRWRVSPRMCGTAARCVSLTNCSRQPAAATAAGASVTSKPDKSRVPNCLHSNAAADSESKCHGGRSRTADVSAHQEGIGASSATSSSAGFSRSSSARSASSLSTCMTQKRPLARSSHARPVTPSVAGVATAARKLACFASSSASSVSVPGVTTRTTSRSTGPLLVRGSPICSQIATDSPSRTRRAR